MRKTTFLAALLCSLFAFLGVHAQNPITTLEHAGVTTVFYGLSSFNDAYNASVNGDELYLSAGYFSAPASIAKGIKVYGAGHFPDSANVAKRTTILTGLNINKGADSLRLEGLYIDGYIRYDAANSVDYVKVIRCRMSDVSFNTNSAAAAKDYCSYEECFIDGYLNFNNYGISLMITRSIISGQIHNILNSGLFDGNIMLYNGYCPYNCNYVINNVFGSEFKNNIIITKGYLIQNCTSNRFFNNMICYNFSDYGNNSSLNNYISITQANIFVNQTGNSISYSHDYHLKNPETYIGTDNTQVGLYGSEYPFKEKGVASNPAFLLKSVSPNTDANGNLQINFKVKAQER
jgi:hypothetical protein